VRTGSFGQMPVSYWIDSTPETEFPALSGEVRVDVAVLGGGITGLTAATLLKEAGKTVALVEARRIVRGVTGYTTAKVTAGHGLIYDDLTQSFGERGARIYAHANQAAIEHIASWVEQRGISCDFERATNYVYSEEAKDVERMQREADAASRAGLPASFVREVPLPFDVQGAVALTGQAQFHPRKYLLPLAQALPGDGSHVLEQTRATGVSRGRPARVETPRGVVVADHVFLATHIPFLDRGLFFAKAHPHRSYAITAPIDPARAPEGMYINAGTPSRSIRTVRRDGEPLLLIGGDGHKPGEEPDTEQRYRNLETFMRDRFGIESEVTHRWSTQDYMSVDRVPYVGRLTRRAGNLYAATGFGKWGLTNGTVAALIVSDAILGRENEWAELFDAQRLKPRAAARRFTSENAKVAWRFFADRVRTDDSDRLARLQPGQGAVVRRGTELVAVSRDDAGELTGVSAICTHLRCVVAWNTAERSWDCPCHGARFLPDGSLIQWPATRDLEPKSLPD